MDALKKVRLNEVLTAHAGCAGAVGLIFVLTPHRFVGTAFGTHFAHEVLRCYGALNLALAWVAYQSRRFTDYRYRRCLCEAFCLSYSLHTLALIRANATAATGQGFFSIVSVLVCLFLALLYGYFRFIGATIKRFQLPSHGGKADL